MVMMFDEIFELSWMKVSEAGNAKNIKLTINDDKSIDG